MASGLSVLMTTDTVGGVFSYALALARELVRRGATVHVATMGETMRPEQRAAMLAVPQCTLHESTYALEWMDDPWDDVARAGEWLLRLERELRPDVVHLNGYCHGDAGFRAPVVVVAHSCVLSWWRAVLGGDAPPKYDRYRRGVRRGLAAADAVIAPTAAMMRCLSHEYGPLRRSYVVHNGAPDAAPRGVAKERFVLAAGRLWDKAKNIEALSAVAPRLSLPVKVAGSDAHPDGTRRPLARVSWLGWLDEGRLGAVMERAAIFALPARYEPFGLSPLEAAQRGCALVLGDIESLREVWGDAAVFVPPDDHDALVSALEGLAGDGSLVKLMSRRARERAERYTARRMAEGTAAVYAEAMRRAPEVQPCA